MRNYIRQILEESYQSQIESWDIYGFLGVQQEYGNLLSFLIEQYNYKYDKEITIDNYWEDDSFIDFCMPEYIERKEAIDNWINEATEGDSFHVYRTMTVDDNFFNDIMKNENVRLGEDWTAYRKIAEESSFWKDSDKPYDILIEALINQKHVNWEDTLRQNFIFEVGEVEAEIRIAPTSPIKVLSIEILAGNITLSEKKMNKIKNGKYYA